ncbi:thiamine pyrophosphate-requiring protein (plasmid) [Pseudonocardia bannensis]|uniref:Thiamine pyrophosphate-requiring protein n=1 Tax=Pseudonocardia bannensis TaxID=630973 RepID=A0A848DNM8_9PSEU|nr:thiamine pyrophosphate-requiring protein [Pseudonocardia bannensis]NMH94352.1 thiamine pyrophosphate-requiring protein [Pseudonocardia bannensis]
MTLGTQIPHSPDRDRTPAPGSTAERYLTALRALGVQTLFVNAGTDFAPLVEAYAQEGSGGRYPVPVLAGHENVVAGMAHGAYLMTGQPQAVMFHVSVGTANAVCAVINAARERVPMIVTAGRTPILEDGAVGARDTAIHWAQEMYDQAGMVREVVKWDYELRSAAQVEAVVRRAVSVACAQPRGPVYLTLPREVLAGPATDGPRGAAPVAVPAGPAPDPTAVRELADRLAEARYPVVVTTAAGADPDAVEMLSQLCERYAIGVAEAGPRYLNVPADHPFHLGLPTEAFGEADVLLFLECDVPWIARRGAPRDDAFVAQAGLDPLTSAYPMRTQRLDLGITTATTSLLTALDAAMADRADRIPPERADTLAVRAAEHRHRLEATFAGPTSGAITKPLLSRALAEVLDDDAVVFNEYWADPRILRRRTPGTYFYLPAAGGLGWALPAALGAKHAAPERTVVAAVGDGAYLFANPAACHHASAKHGLPVLTVVANNARWDAVDASTRSVYPDGVAVRTDESRLSDLSPQPAFARYVEASGGHGEEVTDLDGLRPALRRALHAVQVEGQQALLDVRCAR